METIVSMLGQGKLCFLSVCHIGGSFLIPELGWVAAELSLSPLPCKMRNSGGVKHAWLRAHHLLEVGTGLGSLLTGKLFLTLSCNLILIPISWWKGFSSYGASFFGGGELFPVWKKPRIPLSKLLGEAEQGHHHFRFIIF